MAWLCCLAHWVIIHICTTTYITWVVSTYIVKNYEQLHTILSLYYADGQVKFYLIECCFLGRFFNEEALWPKHSCFNRLGHYWIKIVFYKQISLACFSNLDHLIFYQRKSQPQSFELAGYNLICTFSPLSS